MKKKSNGNNIVSVFSRRIQNSNGKLRTVYISSIWMELVFILEENVEKMTYKQSNLWNRGIPHWPRIPRIDKYLDSWLIRTQFVKILTDSHSP